MVFDRASPCRLLADTHHSNSTALLVGWCDTTTRSITAVTIFTVSNQTMLQFIHKLLMLSKQALGTATFLFILAVLCTALVVRVGLLAHVPRCPKQHHIPNTFGINVFHTEENNAACFKTTMDLVPAPNSSAFRPRDMMGYSAGGKPQN